MEIFAKIVNVSIFDIQLASEYVCAILDLKSEIFAENLFLDFQVFIIKKNRQLFCYEGTAPYISLNIAQRLSRVTFHYLLSSYLWKYLSK